MIDHKLLYSICREHDEGKEGFLPALQFLPLVRLLLKGMSDSELLTLMETSGAVFINYAQFFDWLAGKTPPATPLSHGDEDGHVTLMSSFQRSVRMSVPHDWVKEAFSKTEPKEEFKKLRKSNTEVWQIAGRYKDFNLTISEMPQEYTPPANFEKLEGLMKLLNMPEAILQLANQDETKARQTLQFSLNAMREYTTLAKQHWGKEVLQKIGDSMSAKGYAETYDGIRKIIEGGDRDYGRLRVEIMRLSANKVPYESSLEDIGDFPAKCLASYQVSRDMKEGLFAPFIRELQMKLNREDAPVMMHLAPLKGMARFMEKAVLRSALELPWDIVRCQLEFSTVAQMIDAANMVIDMEGVRIIEVNDKFSNPKNGWSDISIYIQFDDSFVRDAVAEIQLVHQKLMIARVQLHAHDSYDQTRFAAELARNMGGWETVSVPWSKWKELSDEEVEGWWILEESDVEVHAWLLMLQFTRGVCWSPSDGVTEQLKKENGQVKLAGGVLSIGDGRLYRVGKKGSAQRLRRAAKEEIDMCPDGSARNCVWNGIAYKLTKKKQKSSFAYEDEYDMVAFSETLKRHDPPLLPWNWQPRQKGASLTSCQFQPSVATWFMAPWSQWKDNISSQDLEGDWVLEESSSYVMPWLLILSFRHGQVHAPQSNRTKLELALGPHVVRLNGGVLTRRDDRLLRESGGGDGYYRQYSNPPGYQVWRRASAGELDWHLDDQTLSCVRSGTTFLYTGSSSDTPQDEGAKDGHIAFKDVLNKSELLPATWQPKS
eukprot:TRINITY_DN76317_c0_g1_i1.p1 TRINITY_DN76317_c0_g1~~TRINITY_DN76317_c0_g1_i1.p1  ORF type:complete len:769 (-),score=151.69 TRINITY_DN76317_c0_g1_i1:235-2541(-)